MKIIQLFYPSRNRFLLKHCISFFLGISSTLLGSNAIAQTPGWSVIATSPSPILANASANVTIRVTASEFGAGPLGLTCTNFFGSRGVLSVNQSGGKVTLEHDTPEGVVGGVGERFCDKTFAIPALPPGVYALELKLTTFTGLFPPRIYGVGSLCVGTCSAQQVPLNFSAGAPFWWLAIASLFGFGAYSLRRRGFNRRK
jgi:hypothetical protein